MPKLQAFALCMRERPACPNQLHFPVRQRRSARRRLGAECVAEVTRVQLDGVYDIRMDAIVYDRCGEDERRLCGNVRHGGARVHACLVGGVYGVRGAVLHGPVSGGSRCASDHWCTVHARSILPRHDYVLLSRRVVRKACARERLARALSVPPDQLFPRVDPLSPETEPRYRNSYRRCGTPFSVVAVLPRLHTTA